jgi:hypothetical protein
MSDALKQSLDDLHLWAEGIYRRGIVLLQQNGMARGAMVDEQHHANVSFTHDGKTITSIHGELLRRPWTTCGSAPDELQKLVGLPLKGLLQHVGLERWQQCNHLFDILLLLVAQVERQESERWYAVDIGRDPKGGFSRTVRLRSSADQNICWQIVSADGAETRAATFEPIKDIILGDSLFEGVVVTELLRHLPPDLPDSQREALFVLRRAIHVAARNRAETVIEGNRAEEFEPPPSCYAYQPVRLGKSVFVSGMRRDFTSNPAMVFELLDQSRAEIRLHAAD